MAARRRRQKAEKTASKTQNSGRMNTLSESEEDDTNENSEQQLDDSPQKSGFTYYDSISENDGELQDSSEINCRRSSTEIDQAADFPIFSLDVLAQVASATLAQEPSTSGMSPIRKLTLRHVQSMEVLSLDQLKRLSDKALVNLFSEMTGDEIKRNYTYTCFLVPGKCHQQYSSFGNEMKARIVMCRHLREHIRTLIAEGGPKLKFTAEPIQTRKKKLLISKYGPKPRGKVKKTILGSPKAVKSNYTVLRNPDQYNENLVFEHRKNLINSEEEGSEKGIRNKFRSKGRKNDKKGKNKHSKKFKENENITEDQEVDIEGVASLGSKEDSTPPSELSVNDQLIVDILRMGQPFHDHCYTNIFGSRRQLGVMKYEIESSGDEMDQDNNCSRTIGLKINKHRYYQPAARSLALKVTHSSIQGENNLQVPVIQYARLAYEGTPLVTAEEEVDVTHIAIESSSTHRPYPPMPKFELARKGRMFVPEEMIASSADEMDKLDDSPRKRAKAKGRDPNADWERKTALRCIRELRSKKKDDKVALLCRICRDKTFTAAATLMYHYRSHAGIKPFVCLICNTTFTRQHSLNYHMLIHNNQSRFTCADCGRKFRHPSHFKEHIRRHTGETPFVCSDCPLRFKTRNTFKRHLKTRHGKLLTASGISLMSPDEFRKIATKPYKKRRDPYEVNPDSDDAASDSNSERASTKSSDKQQVLVPSVSAQSSATALAPTDSGSKSGSSASIRTLLTMDLPTMSVLPVSSNQSTYPGKMTYSIPVSFSGTATASNYPSLSSSGNVTYSVLPVNSKTNTYSIPAVNIQNQSINYQTLGPIVQTFAPGPAKVISLGSSALQNEVVVNSAPTQQVTHLTTPLHVPNTSTPVLIPVSFAMPMNTETNPSSSKTMKTVIITPEGTISVVGENTNGSQSQITSLPQQVTPLPHPQYTTLQPVAPLPPSSNYSSGTHSLPNIGIPKFISATTLK